MIKQIQRIERLHQLIKRKATGAPKVCAEMLEISERQLYNTLGLMKELGAPIYFDIVKGSYCYEHKVECSFGFFEMNTVKELKGSYIQEGREGQAK